MSAILDWASSRWLSIVLRSLHVVTMGVLLGGVAFAAPPAALRSWIDLAVASGVLLCACDLLGGRMALTQGAGVVMILKLALLALGLVVPAQRLGLYLVATFIAGVGSHMPATWRHFSFVAWRVVERKRRHLSAARTP